MVSFEKVNKR